MVVLELAFDDDPRRLTARPAHRERLKRLHAEGRVLMAGPWQDDSGAMLIFVGEDDEVDRLIADDPYYTTPGVRVTARRRWAPVVGVDH